MKHESQNLQDAILHTLGSAEVVDNKTLYNSVAKQLELPLAEKTERAPVGKSQSKHNLFERKCRWQQQTLKVKGLIRRVSKGAWSLTSEGKQVLSKISTDRFMIAASTSLGVIVWGDARKVFNDVITDDIHLCVTSVPYLGIERSYGTHRDMEEYISFILSILEPIRKRMLPGANLALNISNDSVLKKQFGARSHYLEHLILRIASELDLVLMDRLVWHAPDKAPKTYQVTRARTHLISRYEPILWFCSDPSKTFADNRRVLLPYKEYMKRLIEQNGDTRRVEDSDYQSVSRKGGFANDNGGSIPGNVINIPTYCKSNRSTLRYARELGLPQHGALFPKSLATFLMKWLCPPDGFVIDPCGGYSTVGAAAEELGLRWATSELHWEYIRPSLLRLEQKDGYLVNPQFSKLNNPELRLSLAS